MKTTRQFITTLFGVGYNISLSIGNGFDADFDQIDQRANALEALDYDALLAEVADMGEADIARQMVRDAANANGIDCWRYQWRQLVVDAEALIVGLPELLKYFKDKAKIAEASGEWSKEQTTQYIWRCTDLANTFAKKLQSFIGVFQRAVVMLKPEALPIELATKRALDAFVAVYDRGLLLPEGKGYRWLGSKALLAFFVGRLYCRDYDDILPDGSVLWYVQDRMPKGLADLFVDNSGKTIDIAKVRGKHISKDNTQKAPDGWVVIDDILGD